MRSYSYASRPGTRGMSGITAVGPSYRVRACYCRRVSDGASG